MLRNEASRALLSLSFSPHTWHQDTGGDTGGDTVLPLLLIPLWHLMSRAQDSLPLPIMSSEWKVHERLRGAGDALPPKAFPELASYIVVPKPSLPQPGLEPTPQASEGSRGFTLLAFLSP